MTPTLIINSGSSSLKFQLIHMPQETVLASGLVERIGQSSGKVHYRAGEISFAEERPIKDHSEALKEVTALLMDRKKGVISDPSEIPVIGHRVVHGGKAFSDTVEITQKVKNQVEQLFSLAPLHNPPNLKGIEVAEEIFPQAKQIAVFDTAFHQTIPEKAHRYAIPSPLYHQEAIRVYGFHGTSHQYVSRRANELLGTTASKLVSIHLGNGCSMTAIHNGKSVDHTLGFGPVNGLIMGTRSGDIDQSVIFYLVEKRGYSIEQVSDLLHHKSGMLGLCGHSDLRDIEAGANSGDPDCQLALEMNAYRIKKYLGAYCAAMNGLDAVIFTAGIGENSEKIRELVCREMTFLGLELDPERNRENSERDREIQKEGARVKIFVIPTREELEIARQSFQLYSEAER